MIKKAIVLCALCVVMFSGISAFAAQDSASFGHTWKTFTDKEKEAFLIGVASAVQLTCEPLALVEGKDKKPTVDQDKYAQCFNDFAGIDRFKVIAEMDAFYNDAKNINVPLSGAYRLLTLKLRGVKVDDLLAQARKYGDALKKKLEEDRGKAAN